MVLNNIKLITFDVTNTLLKFRIPPGQQYSRIGTKFGFQVNEKQVAGEFKRQYKDMSKKYPNFGYKSDLTWEEWWTLVVKNTLQSSIKDEMKLREIACYLIDDYKKKDTWLLAEGSKELLDYIRYKKIKLGVISNFDPRLHIILKNMEIDYYFDFILPSYEAGYMKPDRRIFEKALICSEIVGIEPKEAVHIGDNFELDYKGAINAEWQALLINKNSNYNIESSHLFLSLIDLSKAFQNKTVIL